jgi:hypothetical protein
MKSEVLSKGFATGGLWREAAIPNIGCVGTAEDRICRSKGHQRGTGKVDSVGLREAVALRNASRSGVGSF